jgi:hypothetical protein
MTLFYLSLICLSAALITFGGVRLYQRLAPLFRYKGGIGMLALLPAIAFLMVIGLPGPALSGALILSLGLVLGGERMSSPLAHGLLIVLAVAVGLMGIGTPDAAYAAKMPPVMWYAVAALVWIGMSLSAPYMPSSAGGFTMTTAPAWLAVAASWFLLPGDARGAMDVAVILSALFGLLVAGARHAMGEAARYGFVFLITYLQIMAVWHGAWMAAGASICLWLAAAGWMWVQADPWGQYDA